MGQRFRATAVLVFLLCIISPVVHADTIGVISGCGSNCGQLTLGNPPTLTSGYSFTIDLGAPTTISSTDTRYAFSFTITNLDTSNDLQDAAMGSFSVTLFNNQVGNPSISSFSSNLPLLYATDYTALPGKTDNGAGNCNGHVGGAVCVQPTGSTLYDIGPGGSVTFSMVLDINPTLCTHGPCILPVTSWDVLANGDYINVGRGRGNGYALSNYATPLPSPVPEPGTFMLFGVGILGSGGLIRRVSDRLKRF